MSDGDLSPPSARNGEHRRGPLFALLGANAVSLIGSTLTLVALPWFVLQTTGSPAKTGLTGFFVALPHFVAGIGGGIVVDRFGFKRVSVLADLVSCIGIVLVPLLHRTIGLEFWQLLGLVFFGALLEIPGLTARRSLLPELATLARVPLQRVNAAYEGNQAISYLIGPPIAGLLVTRLGAVDVLWLDAASFAISALVISAAVPASAYHAVRRATGRIRDEFLSGLQFLRRDHLLLALAITLAISNFLETPLYSVVLPVFAKEKFGDASDLGLLLAATGAGSVVGTVLFGAIGHRIPRRAQWIGAFLVAPVTCWILVANPPLPIIAAVLALTSIVVGPINALLVTIRHERIPAELRGRVFATFAAISTVAAPLGMIVEGYLIERFGLNSTLIAVAIAAQLIGLSLFYVPALRLMNQRPPLAETAEAAKERIA